MRRISRCLLAVVMAAGLAATARAADVDPLLPKETEYVVHMNFKQMMESDIVKKYAMEQIKQALQGEDLKGILDTLGLDPTKDLEQATVGAWGGGEEMNVVGVIKGKFDAKKMFDGVKELSAKAKDKVEIVTEKVDDKEVTLVKMTQDSGKPIFLTVADDSTILMSSEKKYATAALTAFNKKEKAKVSKELSALVLKQDDKASLYFCGVTTGKFKDVPVASLEMLKGVGIDGETMKGHLEKMNTIAVTLNVGKEVKLTALMGMKDADAAEEFNGTLKSVVDTAKSFLPFLVSSQKNAKELAANLKDSLDVKAKDKDVTFGFAVSAKAIGDMVGKDEK